MSLCHYHRSLAITFLTHHRVTIEQYRAAIGLYHDRLYSYHCSNRIPLIDLLQCLMPDNLLYELAFQCKYTTTVLALSGPSKTLLKSSKSCVCEIFRVLKYLLSIFLLYTHPCRMISSKQKCCLLLNGVSTESQKLTSVRQLRRDFSPTRNMTRMHVGLALSYVKLLLSSWKIYMCNLMAWYTNK